MIRTLIFVIILFFFSLPNIYSQVKDEGKELQLIKQLTELTQEHTFLHSFEGDWKIKGLNYLGEDETSVLGKATVTNILGGHYLEIAMELSESFGSSHARLTLGFDTKINKFTFYSVDDYENSGLYCYGEKQGEKIVFEGSDYSIFKKKNIRFRIEIERESENKFFYKFYNETNGKFRLMIEYYFYKQ